MGLAEREWPAWKGCLSACDAGARLVLLMNEERCVHFDLDLQERELSRSWRVCATDHVWRVCVGAWLAGERGA